MDQRDRNRLTRLDKEKKSGEDNVEELDHIFRSSKITLDQSFGRATIYMNARVDLTEIRNVPMRVRHEAVVSWGKLGSAAAFSAQRAASDATRLQFVANSATPLALCAELLESPPR